MIRIRNPIEIGTLRLEPWMVAIPVVVLAGGTAYGATRLITRTRLHLPPGAKEPRNVGAPFARGIRRPVWPVVTRHKKRGLVSYKDVDGEIHGRPARRFGARRDEGNRNHAGIDLFANYNDPVVAMGNGVVTATQSFHLGSHAIFVDHGNVVVMYAEVTPKSWSEFGVGIGSKVKKGDPIARVACMNWKDGFCASHMLHLETYAPGTTRNKRWFPGKAISPAIRDPSRLLLQARR